MAHALLSPSGASRWIACTPSARMEQGLADTAGDAAKEGTLAHALIEVLLKQALGMESPKKLKADLAKIKKDEFYSAEMLSYMEDLKTYVMELYAELQAEHGMAYIFLETKFDMSDWVPEGFGTGDICLIAGDVLYFIDLKYGKGVPVYSEFNKQMMLYALGAIREFGIILDFKQVSMTIYQPRLNNTSTWVYPVEDLILWADNELRPKAQMAWEGKGEFNPGDACKFCKAKPTCQALADYCMEAAKHEFKIEGFLSDEGVVEALQKGPLLVDWVNSVQKYALQKALDEGKQWPGYKLVEGKSNRRFIDEVEVAKVVLSKGYKEDQIFTKSLIGIGKMETLLGKQNMPIVLDGLILKPSGAPTLVPESDKRPVYRSVESVFNVVADE